RFIRAIVEAIKNGKGDVARLGGAAQDITEQVKATELLRESEARLRSAERMTHVGNWIWDVKANHGSWAEGLFGIMGQPAGEGPGYARSQQMVVAGDRNRLEEWVRDCIAKKCGSFIEVRIARPDGDTRTVAFTSEVLLDEDGSPERMFGTC